MKSLNSKLVMEDLSSVSIITYMTLWLSHLLPIAPCSQWWHQNSIRIIWKSLFTPISFSQGLCPYCNKQVEVKERFTSDECIFVWVCLDFYLSFKRLDKYSLKFTQLPLEGLKRCKRVKICDSTPTSISTTFISIVYIEMILQILLWRW